MRSLCPVLSLLRLTMAGCYPRADGECTLCFLCVNRCPGRAIRCGSSRVTVSPTEPESPGLGFFSRGLNQWTLQRGG